MRVCFEAIKVIGIYFFTFELKKFKTLRPQCQTLLHTYVYIVWWLSKRDQGTSKSCCYWGWGECFFVLWLKVKFCGVCLWLPFFKLISKTNKLQNKQKRHSTFNERKRQYFFVKYNCCCCSTGAFYFRINFNWKGLKRQAISCHF